MREWTPATQHALLRWLADATQAHAESSGPEPIWTVTKDGRELRCVAVHLPTGIDVRLLEGEDFRRTELCRDVPTLKVKSEAWLQALTERGWARR